MISVLDFKKLEENRAVSLEFILVKQRHYYYTRKFDFIEKGTDKDNLTKANSNQYRAQRCF